MIYGKPSALLEPEVIEQGADLYSPSTLTVMVWLLLLNLPSQPFELIVTIIFLSDVVAISLMTTDFELLVAADVGAAVVAFVVVVERSAKRSLVGS